MIARPNALHNKDAQFLAGHDYDFSDPPTHCPPAELYTGISWPSRRGICGEIACARKKIKTYSLSGPAGSRWLPADCNTEKLSEAGTAQHP
jgi:hypothetical protein